MKKIYALLIIALLVFAGCIDDGGSDGPTGTLEVTVNTSNVIWGYPEPDPSSTDDCFRDSTTAKKFGYPLVGGTLSTDDANKKIKEDNMGDRINIVYIYSALGVDSESTPVLYKRTSSANNSNITITGVETGEYYVIAFYDYRSGGDQENLMNRYDRYSIYADSADAETGTSTPFVNKAAKITISEDQTTSITLDIDKDWVLGKPKIPDGDTGRIFLNSDNGDTIPTP